MRPRVAKRTAGETKFSEIGSYLRELRAQAKLTTRQVAKETALSAAYVGKTETGERYPSEEALKKLAALYRIPENVLLRLGGYLNPWDEILPYSQIVRCADFAFCDPAIRDSPLVDMVRHYADVVTLSYFVELYMRFADRQLLTTDERKRVREWLLGAYEEHPDAADLDQEWKIIRDRHYDPEDPDAWQIANQVVDRLQQGLGQLLKSAKWIPTEWDVSIVHPIYPENPGQNTAPTDNFIATAGDVVFDD